MIYNQESEKLGPDPPKVQSGQTDAAVILLPLINDLREAYGESAVVAQAAQQQTKAPAVEAPIVATQQAPVTSKKSKKSRSAAGKGGACL